MAYKSQINIASVFRAITVSTVILLVSFSSIANAQTSSPSPMVTPTTTTTSATKAPDAPYTLLEPLPCLDTSQPDCQGTQVTQIHLSNFFQYAFNLLIALSAVAAVFMMTWGGFEYMTTDSWQGKENGKTKFNNAIIGLLMVLSAFLILKTVNPKLVEIPAGIDRIKVANTESPNSIFALLDKLDKQLAEQSLQASHQATVEKEVAKQQLTKIQQTLDELKANNASPIEIQKTTDTLNSTASTVLLRNAKEDYEARITDAYSTPLGDLNGLEKNTVPGLLDTVNKSLNAIVTTHSAIMKQLDQNVNSNTPNQKQGEINEFFYARGMLLIQQYRLQYVQSIIGQSTNKKNAIQSGTDATNNTNFVINSVAPSIKDTALKQQLIDKANENINYYNNQNSSWSAPIPFLIPNG